MSKALINKVHNLSIYTWSRKNASQFAKKKLKQPKIMTSEAYKTWKKISQLSQPEFKYLEDDYNLIDNQISSYESHMYNSNSQSNQLNKIRNDVQVASINLPNYVRKGQYNRIQKDLLTVNKALANKGMNNISLKERNKLLQLTTNTNKTYVKESQRPLLSNYMSIHYVKHGLFKDVINMHHTSNYNIVNQINKNNKKTLQGDIRDRSFRVSVLKHIMHHNMRGLIEDSKTFGKLAPNHLKKSTNNIYAQILGDIHIHSSWTNMTHDAQPLSQDNNSIVLSSNTRYGKLIQQWTQYTLNVQNKSYSIKAHNQIKAIEKQFHKLNNHKLSHAKSHFSKSINNIRNSNKSNITKAHPKELNHTKDRKISRSHGIER